MDLRGRGLYVTLIHFFVLLFLFFLGGGVMIEEEVGDAVFF